MINFVMLGLPLLCGAMASPSLAQKAESVVVVNEVQPKLVSYNDNDYKITLNVNELNDYIWNNLGNSLDQLPTTDINNTSIYNYSDSSTYSFEDYDGTYISYVYENSNIGFSYEGANPNKFHYEVNGVVTDFSGQGIVWNLNSYLYPIVKTAIQQDILDNTASMPTIADLFTPITQAITSFVGALGQAFSSVTALFWTTGENAGPTFLGLLVLIGVGVGLIYGAYRIIKGLMHRI